MNVIHNGIPMDVANGVLVSFSVGITDLMPNGTQGLFLQLIQSSSIFPHSAIPLK